VSGVFSPAVVLPLSAAYMAWSLGSPAALYWTLFYILVAILVPLGFILWRVRQGKLTDFHIMLREQRLLPMLLVIVCVGVAWGVMLAGGAPERLLVVLGMALVLTIFLAVITLRWKISIHACVNAAVWLTAWSMYSLNGWLAAALILLVAWARVRLGRHTVLQTAAGVGIGLVFGVAALGLSHLLLSGL
jgi:membrane-associated phospholipid phosphatase